MLESDRTLVADLLTVAERGLAQSVISGGGQMAFTRLGVGVGSSGLTVRSAGASLRYGAIAALGAGTLSEVQQRAALGGVTAREFTGPLISAAESSDDPGAVALVCWAAAELGHADAPRALARLRAVDDGRAVVPTVQAAWTVIALLAAEGMGGTEAALADARARLLGARHPGAALFPHMTSPSAGPWLRRHVGCFADQVYPIQALARLHAQSGDPVALESAASCAERISQLQGAEGQWWWHYDSRTGDVVEGYPVYSVHQHGMAPMALFELEEAGGPASSGSVLRGLRWLVERPETSERLIREDVDLIWRKVGRREPRPKTVRGVQGATTAIRRGLHLPGVDALFPPGPVDYECRPYELGWLLYAWNRKSAAYGGTN